MKDCEYPALGLEYVTEYLNPRDDRDVPLYSCSLWGCKSAWGPIDDMQHHIRNFKHIRNYFINILPDDKDMISQLTRNELISSAVKYEEEAGGQDERNYGVILIVRNYEKYCEIKHRPTNLSMLIAKFENENVY